MSSLTALIDTPAARKANSADRGKFSLASNAGVTLRPCVSTYYTAMQDGDSAAADQVAFGERRLVQVTLSHRF
jgi:hypothetical protein